MENRDMIHNWIIAKEQEKNAQEIRRNIEDELIKKLGFLETDEGTMNFEEGEYKVKIIGRFNRRVDCDMLRELAQGIDIDGLFKWSAEIKVGAWKNTDRKITDILAPAIVVTPGRASFIITKGEK